jgi:hypothetical protein
MIEIVPPRGERNHNPCNLRYNRATPWQGLDNPPLDDHGLCRFVDDLHGLRAGAKDIHNKFARDGLKTVRAIVDKYAPPNENDTAAYIAFVAERMGVDPDAQLALDGPDQLFAFVKAVVQEEEGRDIYPDALVREAVVQALAA